MKILKTLLLLGSYILLMAFIGCAERSSDAEAKTQPQVEPPQQIISLEEAKKMYDMYGERRVSMIQHYEDSVNISKRDTAKFDVARYTYYDYKTIKQYLAYIEQEAAKAGVEISSLRFYYSNYPDEKTFADGTPVIHPRQNSIFIIPALNQKGEEFAFLTEETGQAGEKRAVLLNGQLDYIEEKTGMNTQEQNRAYAGFSISSPSTPPLFNNGSTVLNHGGAAPPPYK